MTIVQPIYVLASPTDGDGIPDKTDSCSYVTNSGQDTDHDGIDDACDPAITLPVISTPAAPTSDSNTTPTSASPTTTGIANSTDGSNSPTGQIINQPVTVNTVNPQPSSGSLTTQPITTSPQTPVSNHVISPITTTPIAITPIAVSPVTIVTGSSGTTVPISKPLLLLPSPPVPLSIQLRIAVHPTVQTAVIPQSKIQASASDSMHSNVMNVPKEPELLPVPTTKHMFPTVIHPSIGQTSISVGKRALPVHLSRIRWLPWLLVLLILLLTILVLGIILNRSKEH